MRMTTIKEILSGSAAEINGGSAVSYEPSKVPMRLVQLTVHSDATETGSIDMKIDSAEGSNYDTIVKNINFDSDSDFFANWGEEGPILYVKKSDYSTKDKLVFDGTSISGNIYITMLLVPYNDN